MSEYFWSDPFDSDAPEPGPAKPTWGDYGATFGAVGVPELAASVPAAARWATEGAARPETMALNALSEYLQGTLQDVASDNMEELSPVMRERLEAALTDGDFWSHPFSSTAAKATRMAPSLLAAVIPATLFSGPIAATLAAGTMTGGISAATTVDDIYQMTDNMPDEELQQASTYYAGLRSMGMDEGAARSDYNKKLIGAKPALLFMLGMATGTVGPAGQIVRGLKGAPAHAGEGFIKRVAKGAGEGALAEGIQTGAEAFSSQHAAVEGGLQPGMDGEQLLNAVLEGTLLGGVFGGAAGAVFRGKRSSNPAPTPDESAAAGPVPTTEPINEPAATSPDPAPASAPDPVTVVPVGTPAPDQQVALDLTTPEAPPVVEAAQPAVAASPVPAPVSPQVPPDVTAASTRLAEPQAPIQPTPVNPAPLATPAAETVTPGVTPTVQEPTRGPRILKPVDKASRRLAEQTAATNQAKIRENIAKMAKEEAGPQGKNWTQAEIAKREADGVSAKAIFEQNTQADTRIPTSKPEIEALRNRVDAIVAAATEAGIKIPTKVGYEGTADHVVWLREVKDLQRKFKSKNGPTQDHIIDFLMRERAALDGDFTIMRGERSVGGDVAKRVGQGNVEQRADTSTGAATEEQAAAVEAAVDAPPAPATNKAAPTGVEGDLDVPENTNEGEIISGEKNAVETKTTASAKGSVRDTKSEDRPGSEVRSVEITPELRAKYEAGPAAKVQKAEAKPVSEKAAKVKKVSKERSAKVTPKTEAQRVAAAAKNVNRNPTEAQKEAGNYEKGHTSLKGLNITIETPRGAERSGTTPSGEKWSVKMPDHYGYVKGTKGADGDQVDVYVGPTLDSQFVFVLDQVDIDSRAFDEHKVMLGYANLRVAMEAYDAAFSDGRGMERVGDYRVMSLDEFKAWLDSRGTTKPAGDVTTKAEAIALEDVVSSDAREGDSGEQGFKVGGLFNKDVVYPVVTTDGNGALDAIDVEALVGDDAIAGKIIPFIIRRLRELAGNTPVHVMSPDDMQKMAGNKRSSPPAGMASIFPDGHQRVFLNAVTMSDEMEAAETVVHELVHIVTTKGIEAREDIRNNIAGLMDEARRYWDGFDTVLETIDYSLTNEKEFVAEAFANPQVQHILAQTPAPKHIVERLKLGEGQKWSLWDAFIREVRNMLGLPANSHTVLDAIIKVGQQAMEVTGDIKMAENHSFRESPGFLNRRAKQEQVGSPSLLGWRTIDQIAQVAKDYFGQSNPVRKVADAIEMIRVTGERFLQETNPIVGRLYELERKYKGTEHWTNFTTLVHDETMAGVFADKTLDENTQLGKDALDGMWGKAQHAELAARWAKLPQDLKDARRQSMEFFTRQQNEMSLGIIKNRILLALGFRDEAMAERIHNGNTTDADQQALGPALDLILEAKELAKINGPYFPLMRRGDFVVKARYDDIQVPRTGEQVELNVVEFKDRKEAIKFAQQQDTRPTIKSIWVDKDSGQAWVEHNGKQVKIHANDFSAEQRWRVTVQDRHVEFFQTDGEARAAAAALEEQGLRVDGVEERRFEVGDNRTDMLSHQMESLMRGLERREGYRDMTPEQKNELVQALREASIRFLGSTRIQSRRLPRTYVEGASRDLTHNTLDYARMTSGYLARLQHQPALDEAMKAMDKAVGSNEYGKDTTLGRSSIANEVRRRVAGATVFEHVGSLGHNAQRVMTLSFLRHLFSPAYSVVNALQPTMLSLPHLAGRFGAGRAATTLLKVYNDIGARSVIGSGLKGTALKSKGQNTDTPNFFEEVLSRISNSRERAMLRYLADRGSIDPDAGLEIASLIEARDGSMQKVDAGLGYMQGIARQLPRAVETINRTVTALAAYRLEFSRSGDHDAAMVYAQEATNLTQGIYSHTNAPPAFNHPLFRLTLQFKKYGQLVYGLLGHQIGKAIRNTNPGDRAEAVKSLAMIAATHVLMAGTLGLPTEPFKFLVLGANMAGVTDLTWADVENYQRKLATAMFGQGAGEVLTRGLSRALPGGLAFDLSTRVGIADVLTFGEPRSTEQHDLGAYFAEVIGGAPGGMVMDWISGVSSLVSGEIADGAQKLVPLKIGQDSIKAYRAATEGKKSAAGYQTLDPYSLVEAAVRSFGFTPARESETAERRGYFYSSQRRSSEQRNELMQEWSQATPGDRARMWGRVEDFNKGKGRDERLSRSELNEYVKRRGSEQRRGTVRDGYRITKRDKRLFDETARTYNYQ